MSTPEELDHIADVVQRTTAIYRLKLAGHVLRLIFRGDVLKRLLEQDWQGAAKKSGLGQAGRFVCNDDVRFGFGAVANWAGGGALDFNLAASGLDTSSGRTEPDFDDLRRMTTASLSLIFDALQLSAPETTPTQLVTIQSFSARIGENGGYIDAVLSPWMMEWLAERGGCDQWEELEAPLRRVYRAMHGDSFNAADLFCFETRIHLPMGFRIKVPPEDSMLWMSHTWQPGQGAELVGEEVNSPITQLMLLAALARLSDLYRRENTSCLEAALA